MVPTAQVGCNDAVPNCFAALNKELDLRERVISEFRSAAVKTTSGRIKLTGNAL